VQGYTFLQGMDSPHGELAFLGRKSAEELAGDCNARSSCKGFTSTGMLKDKLRPAVERTPLVAPWLCDGLYMKNGASDDGK